MSNRLRKGSPEAKAWGERMLRARSLSIRALGRKREKEFFGSGAPLDPRATRKNPYYFVKATEKTIEEFAEKYFLEHARRNGEMLPFRGLVLVGFTLMDSRAHVFVGFDQRRQEFIVYDGKPKNNPRTPRKPITEARYTVRCVHDGCTYHMTNLTARRAKAYARQHANAKGHRVRGERCNPGPEFHERAAKTARRYSQDAPTKEERILYKGIEIAHEDSARASRSRRLVCNPKDFPNIEKSAFKRGEYVGYGNGVWRIFKWGDGWKAVNQKTSKHIDGRTLEEISKKLEQPNPLAVFLPGNPNPGPMKEIRAKVAGVVYNRVREVRAEKTAHPELKGLYKHPFKKGVQQLALDNGDLLLHSTTGKPLWERV